MQHTETDNEHIKTHKTVQDNKKKKIKITHNIYDPEVSPELRYYPKSNSRGNRYKLLNHTFHYDTRKYSFSARIVNIWNSLPNFVVDVDTVCLFKTRLDKFWMHQDVMYDFAADLTGIGDRSVREIRLL